MNKGHTIKVLDHGFVRYVDHMGDDRRIVEAARISYGSVNKGDEADKKLLKYLWINKHTSPFEMVKVTLNIKMPIFIMRQYVRHRMQNLNEVSARYTELPNEFYIPNKWRSNTVHNRQASVESPDLPHRDLSGMLAAHSQSCYELYMKMTNMCVAREMARMVLPVNIYTEIYSCWDLKNLLHYITLRDEGHAQWEHQQYGRAIKSILTELFPWTMEVYNER